jgi:Gram-negative bacterial TonB protein C-terminal
MKRVARLLSCVLVALMLSKAAFGQVVPPAASNQTANRINVSAEVEAAKLLPHRDPVGPPGVTGTVVLHAVIGPDGNVAELQVISGPPPLVVATLGVVRMWRYAPTLLDGSPVEVDTNIVVQFSGGAATGPQRNAFAYPNDGHIYDQNELAATPIPADPHELVTGRIATPTVPKDVAASLELLDRARRNMDLYGPDAEYKLNVAFTASGSATGGVGSFEEIKGRLTQERWSVHMGDYSIVRVTSNRAAYDEKPPGPIPLRIHMLRANLLWPFNTVRPRDHLRIATAEWNGKSVDCMLLSEMTQTVPVTRGRSWREREYCIDAKTGLLQIYSEAPGIYAVYDYQKPIRFQTFTLARDFTIFEAGVKVIEGHIASIEPLGATFTDAFTINGSAVRPGAVLSIPMHYYSIPGMLAGITIHGPVSKVQPVIVHASLSDEGEVLEAEVLQDPMSEVSKLALDQVKSWHFGRPPGRDPAMRQWETFVEVDVLPLAQSP